MIVPDGAADRQRVGGKSPLEAAATPWMDFIAREGVSGRVRTLPTGLPKGSLVAQLGLLGWDPVEYYPGGRSSAELLGPNSVEMGEGDIAFRANLVSFEEDRLASFNGFDVRDGVARALVRRIIARTGAEFPDIELFHDRDYRSTLLVRDAVGVDPDRLMCFEPHESEGMRFDPTTLVRGTDPASVQTVSRIREYLTTVRSALAGKQVNALFPWSPSKPLILSSFSASTGINGCAAIVGSMAFLHGVARAGHVKFFSVGNGRCDTDYAKKATVAIELLEAGYEFVFVHINAPDEAAHLGDVALKQRCIERIDRAVVGPIVRFFKKRQELLGGVVVLPDHYTNTVAVQDGVARASVHTDDPVPFALWDGLRKDSVESYSETHAAQGSLSACELGAVDVLPLLLGR